MAKFDKRFTGKDNAGLRAEIRRIAYMTEQMEAQGVRKAILDIGRRIALSASGRATLELVADDYAAQRRGEMGR